MSDQIENKKLSPYDLKFCSHYPNTLAFCKKHEIFNYPPKYFKTIYCFRMNQLPPACCPAFKPCEEHKNLMASFGESIPSQNLDGYLDGTQPNDPLSFHTPPQSPASSDTPPKKKKSVKRVKKEKPNDADPPVKDNRKIAKRKKQEEPITETPQPTTKKRAAKVPTLRKASDPVKLWTLCLKEYAATHKVKPPIKKGTEQHAAIRKLFNEKLAQIKK
jgi:hypothetical protein